jgi:hypothetical protein
MSSSSSFLCGRSFALISDSRKEGSDHLKNSIACAFIFSLLSQTIAVNNTYLIQAVYDKAKNKTTIIVLKKNLPIQTSSLTGLKLVKLTTTNGVIGYGW